MQSKILSNNEYGVPVIDMGCHADLETSSRAHETSRTVKEKIQSSQATQNKGLREKQTKHINGRPSVPQKSSGNHPKQRIERKANKEGELVKYMSNLPRYLQCVERGENLQGKALNFGVLDWGRLEKWKHNQNQIPGRSSTYSSSASDASSSFSMVGSSTFSNGINSGTLAHQEKRHPSLHSHLTSSSEETNSVCVKPPRGNALTFQDLKTVPNKASVLQQKLPRMDPSFERNDSDIILEKGKGGDSDPKIIPEMETPSHLEDHENSLCPKGKLKAGELESTKITEQFQEFRLCDQHCPGKPKTIVLLLPRDSTKKNFLGNSQPSDSTKIDDGKPTEAKCKSFSGSFYINNEVQFMELCSDILHSYPFPYKDDGIKESDVKLCSPLDAQGAENSFDVFHSLPCSDGSATVHSKDTCTEKNNSNIKSAKLTVVEPSSGLGPKAVKVDAAKGRYPSPNYPSTDDLGLMNRSFSSKEASSVPQLNSTYVATKSGPVGHRASPCLDNSIRDKTNSNGRARSSPLRRLLDPLLKPKLASHLQSAEPLQDELSSTHRTCKPSDGQLDSCTVQPVKRNLNFLSCNSADVDVLPQEEKHVPLLVQAVLKVTVKDGLPLFTFAVNNSDILAATMKKISTSGKHDCSCIYTFYSFQKYKKKSGGWMNQGSKGKRIDYVPILVGEMKVSGSQCTDIRRNSKDQFMAREFVLFSVEQKQAGQEIQDFQPNSEIAAVVVKVPKETTTGNVGDDGWLSDNHKDLSEMGPPDCSCSSAEHLQSGCCIESQSPSSVVVILPSAVHSLPAKGVPSSLINRWTSGGSCDCGGWDEGCSLRILSSQDQQSRSSSSSKDFCAADQFKLFIQGGATTQENRTVFSLSTFEKGIYSIDFDASISSLQAFSICTAILDSRKLAGANKLLEDKIPQELVSMENDRIMVPTRIEGEAPPAFAPFPPLSPVGRV